MRMSDLLGERVSDLNDVGSKTVETGSIGQTGLAQADRRNFNFVLCRVSLKLMTLINLITEDKYLGITILPPKRNLVPRFNEGAKWKVRNW